MTKHLLYRALIVVVSIACALAQHHEPESQVQSIVNNEPCADGFAAVTHLKALDFLLSKKLHLHNSLTFDSLPLGFTSQMMEISTAQQPVNLPLTDAIDRTTRVIDQDSKPMPILGNSVVRPPQQATMQPVPSGQSDAFRAVDAQEERKVLRAAASVGRLQVLDGNVLGPKWVGLGTAFVIAPGVIATNCHVIEPLVNLQNGEWQLRDEYKDKVGVDFGDLGDLSREQSLGFRVTGLLPPSGETGFDIVFLSVEPSSLDKSTSLPPRVPLFTERIQPPELSDNGQPKRQLQTFLLVGYPDIARSIDPNLDKAYGPFQNETRTSKFVVPGAVTAVNSCKSPLDILSDAASTTGGQSGSILIDRRTMSVIGVHSCCAVYSPDQIAPPPPERFPCATLRNTYYNQAVSSWSILNEPTLSGILKQHGIPSE